MIEGEDTLVIYGALEQHVPAARRSTAGKPPWAFAHAIFRKSRFASMTAQRLSRTGPKTYAL